MTVFVKSQRTILSRILSPPLSITSYLLESGASTPEQRKSPARSTREPPSQPADRHEQPKAKILEPHWEVHRKGHAYLKKQNQYKNHLNPAREKKKKKD